MRKFLFLLVLLVLLKGATFGKEDGGGGGAFLRIGIGARPLSLGKAFVGIADDADSVYWNPAGLTQLHHIQGISMYSEPYGFEVKDVSVEGISMGSISFVYPMDGGALGCSIIYLEVDGICEYGVDRLGNPVEVGREFSDNEIALFLSCAKRVGANLSIGLAVEGIYQRIYKAEYSDIGFGVNAALLYLPRENMRFGFVIRNLIPPTLTLRKRAFEVPLILQAGASYTFNEKITFAIGTDYAKNSSLKFHIGAEAYVFRILSLRFGYTTSNRELSAGFGFDIKKRWRLDYSFGMHELGGTHRVSFGAKF